MRCKIFILTFLILINSFALTGCWDMTDINDHIFVLGLGIDPDEEEGLYRFTFHYANPRGEQSDQSSDKMTYINATIRSSSLPLAVRELIRNSDSEANFEHMQALVLGADYLEKLSFDDIDMLFRMASVRRKCVVVTADINAFDLLSMKFSGISTAVMINRLSNHYSSAKSNVLEGFSLTSLYSKRTDKLSFNLFSVGAVENSNYSTVSPTDKKDSKDISLAVTGISVFRNCRYIGQLGYTELETIRLLQSKQTEGLLNIITDKDNDCCFQIISSKCKTECRIEDDIPVFYIKLNVDCLLIDSSEDAQEYGKEIIEDTLKKRIEHIVSLCRYKYGVELLGLETALRQDQRQWFESNSKYFMNNFSQSQINISVECKIASSGIIE